MTKPKSKIQPSLFKSAGVGDGKTGKPSTSTASSNKQGPRLRNIDEFIGTFVMPGEEFYLTNPTADHQQILLGPGLKVKQSFSNKDIDDSEKTVSVCKAGILSKKKPNIFYIDVVLRNYTPAPKEDVIGIITKKAGDQYLVDIGTRDRLSLSKFSFEGATKKNRPDLKVGDVVHGRILDLPSDYPFELTCVKPSGKADGLGPLENGFVFRVPVYMVSKLLKKTNDNENDEHIELLREMGKVKNVPFETVVGANGFIYVRSKSMIINMLIAQVLLAAVDLPVSEYKKLVQKFEESANILRSST